MALQTIMLNTDPVLARICAAVGSRRRKCYLAPYPAGSTVSTGWDGGSKDDYYMVMGDVVGHGACTALHLYMERDPNPMGDPHGQRRVLPPFPTNPSVVAIVRWGYFCGKPGIPEVWLRPRQS